MRRFVHVGTEAALLAGEPLVDVDETAPLRADSKVLYSSTKARAEQLVLDASREGFQTVVVRPRFVWGRGDTTLLPAMVEIVRAGRFAWIGGGRHRTSITHVDNAVEGLMLGAARGRPGNAYFVTDGEAVVFREFVGELLPTRASSHLRADSGAGGARSRSPARPLGAHCRSPASRRSRASPTGSPRRSARSGSTRRASSSATNP